MSRNITPFRPASVSRNMPIEYFVLANLDFRGPVIGQLAGTPIHETVVDQRGIRYHYAGLVRRDPDGRFDINALQPGEWIVRPGLIYEMQQPALRRRA